MINILSVVCGLLLAVALGFWIFDRDFGLLGSSNSGNRETLEAGEEYYRANTCVDCHGEKGRQPINEAYPKLAGQNADYLYSQLQAIKSGERSYGANQLMRPALETLDEKKLRAIATYLSRQ